MTKAWFAGNFCPREATCSLETGALSPSNGPKVRTMDQIDPPDQPYTATIQVFKDDNAFFESGTQPDEWAKCEGQLLSIPENAALFSLVGNEYGGDGRRTFGIPDLRNETTGPYYIYIIADIGHGR